jgi:hypothetical protein
VQTKFNKYHRKNIHHGQVNYIPGMDGSTCTNQKLKKEQNRFKDKNHMIILIDAEKFFNKIQHLFMIKSLKKIEIKEMYLALHKTNQQAKPY